MREKVFALLKSVPRFLTSLGSVKMRVVTQEEIQSVNGALTANEGFAAAGVVAAAGAIAVIAPVAAGAVLVAVIAISLMDIAETLTS